MTALSVSLPRDATTALLLELAQQGKVWLSAGIGHYGGDPNHWSASLDVITPGGGELTFRGSGRTPAQALHEVHERLAEYRGHRP
jgi:hypothetical protein